jgi:2-polyprenyl-3-methyl-5-hydroxy-6-metoxy-1,4-benzoquinol methylase
VLVIEQRRHAEEIPFVNGTTMKADSRKAHWETVYTSKGEQEVSWFEEKPVPSLELIATAGGIATSALIDVGGGASRLVDALLETGFRAITVLDLSESALSGVKARLGNRAHRVEWIVADVTVWQPQPAAYDIWHDRATFHFLTAQADRMAYLARLAMAVKPGGLRSSAPLRWTDPTSAAGYLLRAMMRKASRVRSETPSI